MRLGGICQHEGKENAEEGQDGGGKGPLFLFCFSLLRKGYASARRPLQSFSTLILFLVSIFACMHRWCMKKRKFLGDSFPFFTYLLVDLWTRSEAK